ncbi:DUF3017 domain-containing protein [Skermania piniformis]|uniref:DUF3017 domain-containing protein n=1 Tax=Skermania pinensis TaxID=39122 RepID=A0ABX8SDY2_9ACTN|nr:DUF3017 domain-containing protein [Skermania piniformis]
MAQVIRTHLPVAIVGVIYIVAVLLVMSDRWRRGALVFGAGTMLAGVARFTVAEGRLGWFAVRGRRFDAAALVVVGAIIVWLAAYIDPLGTG